MGVKEVKLKELLLVFRNGASIKQFEGAEGLPITRIETISDATINPLKVGYANIFDDKYQDYYLQEGDILLSHINSVTHLGKCAIYTNPIDKLIHGMNLLMLRANKDLILPKYLYYVLNSKQFKVQLPKITKKSVNQASMTVTDIGNLKLLIEEDLEQQQKIVEILDKADEIRAKKKLANDKLDEFLKSTFISMFGDPVKNPKKMPIADIAQLATTDNAIKAGPFGSSLKKECYVEKGYKIYGQEQVINNDVNYGDYYIDERKYNSLKMYKVIAGDVLISLVGSYGKLLIIPEQYHAGIINPRLMKITFDKDKINPIFFKYLFANETFQLLLNNNSHGGTMGILNVGIIKKLKIIVPPINEQNKFAKIVEKVEVQNHKNELVIEQMNNLFNSLSQKAFKGSANF